MNLEEIDKQYVLQTYKRNYVNFTHGNNAFLYDDKGDEYIDFMCGISVVNAGHSNKYINDKIKQQIDKIAHISNLFLIKPQAMLAKKIANLFDDNYASFFCNSGTEANEGAIKLARKYGKDKRYKIITLRNSFHGRTITSLKATGQESMHNYFGPFPDGFVYAENLDEIIEKVDETTIAIMIELIQGEGGLENLDKDKVQLIAKYAKENDILLIVDEVQTGIYRTGEFLASMYYKIKPDIITIAKALANSLPIGAIITNHKKILSIGDHGSTFGGNFLSSSAGLATLEYLEKLKSSSKLDDTIKNYQKQLSLLEAKYPNIIIKKVGQGMMGGYRIKKNINIDDIISSAFENKLLIIKAGKNTIRLFPPLSIEQNVLNDGFQKLERVFRYL